ncbi:hypothetical protein Ac2012v2_003613 [Leucoagaricus gongylophorus]
MVIQVYLYSVKYRRDRLWIKLFVLIVFVLDTINSVCDCVYLYDSLILHFTDTQFLNTANWVFATALILRPAPAKEPAFTGVIAALVQVFFAWRVTSLTKKWILGSIVTLGALVGGALGIVTGCEVLKTLHFTEFQDFKVSNNLFQSTILIDLTPDCRYFLACNSGIGRYHHYNDVGWAFRNQKTGFRQSDLMVDRIIRVTIQTGFITSVFAVVDLTVYLADVSCAHLVYQQKDSSKHVNSQLERE